MKTKFRLFSIISALCLFSLFSVQTFAQTTYDTPEKKITIKTIVTEDGKTTETITEIPLDGVPDIARILEELDILENIEIDSDGERIEIRIQKKDGKIIQKNIDITMPNMDEEFFESRPLLGVYIETVDPEVSKETGQPKEGVLITGIVEGSGAENAGLKKGDVITAIDGEAVNNHDAITKIVQSHKKGDKIDVEYYRDGKKANVTSELGETKMMFRHMMKHDFDFEFDDEEFEQRLEEHLKEMKESGQMPHKMMRKFHMEGSNKAFLGVTIAEKNDDSDVEGVVIKSVFENSSAENMGLKAGDIITKINGDDVNTFTDLVDALGKTEPGDKVKISYSREGSQKKSSGEMKSRLDTRGEDFIFDMRCCDPESMKNCKFPKGSMMINTPNDREVMVIIKIDDISKEEAENLSEIIDEEINLDNNLEMMELGFTPNPGTGEFNIMFDLPKEGNTTIRVMDINGRVVFNEDLGLFSGAYKGNINITEEPSGIYFLFVNQGDRQFSKKIVKQ